LPDEIGILVQPLQKTATVCELELVGKPPGREQGSNLDANITNWGSKNDMTSLDRKAPM
jgi:hypothetical protein